MPSFPLSLSEQVADLLTHHTRITIFGDFNYWYDNDLAGPHATELFEILTSLNLIQHITLPTHTKGHILDHIWTHNLALSRPIISPCLWSDHYLIEVTITIKGSIPGGLRRKWNSYDSQGFLDFVTNTRPIINPESGIDSMEDGITTWLQSASDRFAPLTRFVHTRYGNSHRWFSEELKAQKLKLRHLERNWRRGYSKEDRAEFVRACNVYKNAITKAKASHISERIDSARNKSKEIFKIMNDFSSDHRVLPSQDPTQDTCNALNTYFIQKIADIKNAISPSISLSPLDSSSLNPCSLTQFPAITSSTLSELTTSIKSGSPKDCCPPPVLRAVFSALPDSILPLLNTSLSTGTVPSVFKQAILVPLLKKVGADPANSANYRPISLLPYTSKLLEAHVTTCLSAFIESSGFLEPNKAGFRPAHSTEAVHSKSH
ncbi:uncharacterized protein LOC144824797 [Lissotriton helveticus]